MNLIEGLICAAAATFSLMKIFTDLPSFKSSVIRVESLQCMCRRLIYKSEQQSVLIGIFVTVLVVIICSEVLNIIAYKSFRSGNQKNDIPSYPIGKGTMPQMKNVSEDIKNNMGKNNGIISQNLRQSQLLNAQKYQPQPLLQNLQQLGRDKRQFESHWKISPPENKQEDPAAMSMNSSGTIFHFISKKIGSCENLDKQLAHSPARSSKSIKSLNALDQSIIKKRQKSQNFSELDAGGRHSPDRPGSFNNPIQGINSLQSQYGRKLQSLKSNGNKKNLSLQEKQMKINKESDNFHNKQKLEDSLTIMQLSSNIPQFNQVAQDKEIFEQREIPNNMTNSKKIV